MSSQGLRLQRQGRGVARTRDPIALRPGLGWPNVLSLVGMQWSTTEGVSSKERRFVLGKREWQHEKEVPEPREKVVKA